MEAEKILCCDRGDNDGALMAALMNNNNNWMNNPFAYMMFMALFRGGFGGWGGGEAAAMNSGQLDAIRTQMQDNQNSSLVMDAIGNGFNRNDFAISQLAQNLNVDFNTMQRAVCDVQSAIREVGGQVGFSAERVINAANLGNCNVIQALKDCCCQTQQNIIRMGYENQLGQKDQMFAVQAGFDRTNTGIERGFSAVAFQAQQDKCDIIRSNHDNTQRIIDTLNNHWGEEMANKIQDLKFQLSQERQNNYLISQLKTTTTPTT